MESTIRHPARPNLYAKVHKGLRACMANALLGVGGLDTTDDADVKRVLADVRELLDLSRAHLHHENELMHPALEARAPGSSALTAEDHDHHEGSIDELASLLTELERAPRAARGLVQTRLYGALGAFVGESFEHMHVEETENMCVLWATHTDEELVALEQQVVGAVPPADMARFLRWMIAAITPSERAALFSDMRDNAPPAVFDGTFAIAASVLSPTDLEKLSVALAA